MRITLALLVALGAGAALAFHLNATAAGVILAVCAVVPVAWFIADRAQRRSGTPFSATAKKVRVGVALATVAAVGLSIWLISGPQPAKRLGSNSDLGQACDRTYFPQAEEYRGAGPHPIEVFFNNGGSIPRQIRPPSDAAGEIWSAKDPSTVQLVACFDAGEPGPQLGSCPFDSGTAPLHQGRYRGRVLIAHTGASVGELEITGSDTADTSRDCPSMTWVSEQTSVSDLQFFTLPEFPAIAAALDRIVNAPAG